MILLSFLCWSTGYCANGWVEDLTFAKIGFLSEKVSVILVLLGSSFLSCDI